MKYATVTGIVTVAHFKIVDTNDHYTVRYRCCSTICSRVWKPERDGGHPPPVSVLAVFLCPEFGFALMGGPSREPSGSPVSVSGLPTCSVPPFFIGREKGGV
jgi:hypothetical protein